MRAASLLLALAACGGPEPRPPPELQARYDAACANCHESGAADAPRRVVAPDWPRRRERGFDVLMQRVRDGTTGMPPRGLCYDCTEAELEGLVRFVSGWGG